MTKQNDQMGAKNLSLHQSTSSEQSVDKAQAKVLTDVKCTKEGMLNFERKKAPTKSEIMEQLSRERFPWEE